MFATLTQVVCQSVIVLDLWVKCHNFHRATIFLFPDEEPEIVGQLGGLIGRGCFGSVYHFYRHPRKDDPTPRVALRLAFTAWQQYPNIWQLWFGYFMAIGNRFALESGPSNGLADCPPGISSVAISHPACPPYVGCPWISQCYSPGKPRTWRFLTCLWSPMKSLDVYILCRHNCEPGGQTGKQLGI